MSDLTIFGPPGTRDTCLRTADGTIVARLDGALYGPATVNGTEVRWQLDKRLVGYSIVAVDERNWELGRIDATSRRRRFRIQVPGARLRAAQRAFRSGWRISDGNSTVATVSFKDALRSLPDGRYESEAGQVTLAGGTTVAPETVLAVFLLLEMLKVESTVPAAAGGTS